MRVFEDMLDQPEDMRELWIENTCSGDPNLARAVRALSSTRERGAFIPTIPPGPPDESAEHEPPQRISHYRVIGELGRGGMGVVYRGERDDGLFDHNVAIKVLRQTLLSAEARARFATERRILARLKHPHIAQLYDGGVAEDGRSYIVMELINGEPITRYCTGRGLDTAARLVLFRQAADAVDLAHRQLVVHADIKPSNVIVEDGFGVKLLDFSVARLIGEGDDERHQGYTPGYASAARIAGEVATPLDDIFSLGVLLGDLIEDQVGIDADIAAIVAKAIAADPAQRYGSVGALVADLDRWQTYRTVSASPRRRRRAMWLFWRRNRLWLSLAAVALLALCVGLVAITTLYLRSEAARRIADQRYAASSRMADYIIGDVDPALARAPGTLQMRRQLVEQTGRYLNELEANAAIPPALQMRIAAGYLRMAQIYGLDPSGGIGDLAAAKASLAHAVKAIDSVAASDPANPQLDLLRAQAALLDGSEVFIEPTPQAATRGLASLGRAQRLFARYLRKDPNDTRAQLGLWSAQIMPARDYDYLGKPLAGLGPIYANLGKRAMTVYNPAERAERDFITSGSYLLLGEAYGDIDPRRAIFYYSALIDHVDDLQKRGLSDWENDLTQISGYSGRADSRAKLNDISGAAYDEGLAIHRLDHLYKVEGNQMMGVMLAYYRVKQANLDSRLGRFAEARRVSDAAIAWLHRKAYGPSGDPGYNPGYRRVLALALSARARIELASGSPAACGAGRDALSEWQILVRFHGTMPIDAATSIHDASRTILQSCK